MKTHRALIPLLLVIVLVILGLAIGTISAQQFGSGWVGQYFNNTDFSGSPVISRVDAQINFNFGTGSPVPGFVNADDFSVRWNSLEDFIAGTYRFYAGADDGIRVILDGQVIIDNLANTGTFNLVTADVVVAAGTRDIVVEYVERTGNAAVQFYWEPIETVPTPTPGPSPTPTATGLPPIPPGALTATVVRAAVLNVRDAPSLGGNRVGQILRGQTYAVVGRNSDARWFLLQLSNRRAWAYGYYLFVDGNEFNPPIVSASIALNLPPGVTDTGVLAQTKAGMKLRAAPDVLSEQTGRITWGAFLPVVGRTASGDWYQVVWKGTVGWVFTGFLDIVQGDLNNVPIR